MLQFALKKMNGKFYDSGIFINMSFTEREHTSLAESAKLNKKINVFQLNSQVGQFYSSVQGMQK